MRRAALIKLLTVLPQETLTIQGGRDYYRVNEHVNFVCISGKGWPVLHLNWFINDSPVGYANDTAAQHAALMMPIMQHLGARRLFDQLQACARTRWPTQVQVGP